jgi:hypothetical protein
MTKLPSWSAIKLRSIARTRVREAGLCHGGIGGQCLEAQAIVN